MVKAIPFLSCANATNARRAPASSLLLNLVFTITLIAICMVVGSIYCVEAAEADQWRTHGAKANFFRAKGDYRESLKESELALKALTPNTPDYAAIDLQLAQVQTMVKASMLNEADALLTKLEPVVFANFKMTLLEARFWRRKVELRHAQKRFVEEADAQAAASNITLHKFGQTSPIYAEELWQLIQTRLRSKQYELAIQDTLKLRQISEQKIPAADRKRYLTWIANFESSLCSVVYATLSAKPDEPKARQATKLLIDSFAISDSSSAEVWKCWNYSLSALAGITSPCRFELSKFAVNHIKLQTAQGVQLELLAGSASMLLFQRIYYDRPGGNFDERTEQLTQLAQDAIAKMLGGKDLNKNSWYIQVSSMHALTLAKRDKLAEAEKQTDLLIPDPSIVKSSAALNGIFDARHVGLATAYAKRGDEMAVHRQYNKLRALLPLYRLADSNELETAWTSRENESIASMKKPNAPVQTPK